MRPHRRLLALGAVTGADLSCAAFAYAIRVKRTTCAAHAVGACFGLDVSALARAFAAHTCRVLATGNTGASIRSCGTCARIARHREPVRFKHPEAPYGREQRQGEAE